MEFFCGRASQLRFSGGFRTEFLILVPIPCLVIEKVKDYEIKPDLYWLAQKSLQDFSWKALNP